jgi:DNA-3-methyladenine glycosylase II
MRHAIHHLKQADPVLAGLIERAGPFRMAYREPEFATLARSIVYQQLSTKAAATIFGRLEAALGPRGFTPGGLLRLPPERLRECGLSAQKTAYLRDLADKTKTRQIVFARLVSMGDDEVIEHLTSVKGVGVWTAHMFLMFALRRPDVLPVGDLGIRTAMQRLYALETPPPPARMQEIARPWSPWTTVACWYLWRSLDGAARL